MLGCLIVQNWTLGKLTSVPEERFTPKTYIYSGHFNLVNRVLECSQVFEMIRTGV